MSGVQYWEYITHYLDDEGRLMKIKTASRNRANERMRDLLVRGYCAWIIAVPWDDDIPF